jgi:hypothetical protein
LPRFSDCADPAVYESRQFQPNAGGHIFLLHADEIEPLARRAGVSVDRISLFTNPLTAGHVKTEALLRVTPRALVNAFETVTQTLPAFLKRKALVQLAVRFRKR